MSFRWARSCLLCRPASSLQPELLARPLLPEEVYSLRGSLTISATTDIAGKKPGQPESHEHPSRDAFQIWALNQMAELPLGGSSH